VICDHVITRQATASERPCRANKLAWTPRKFRNGIFEPTYMLIDLDLRSAVSGAGVAKDGVSL